ncbi:M16 family metallopeptidase [Arenimonas composti]|nr:pitrilysin family protein [Arenimonas composti]
MRRLVLAAALAALLPNAVSTATAANSPRSGSAVAAVAPIDIESLRIAHETFVLPNGLTVIVHSDHSVPLVGVNVWYHVGSRNEQRGRTGFAHLFEHFFFNGSENYPHGFREAMDDLGANNRNGTTNGDRTNFFEDVPVSALERTLYLEADRMGFLAGNLSDDMLERERGVVQNEKRQGENAPYGRVFGRLVETMYPYSHPYSWSTIGSMEDLQAATMDDIRRWYADWYGPNNAVLVLAGDITVERAKELVTRYFGGIAPGVPVARQERWVPELDADIRDRMQDRVPQTRIYRTWHVPPFGDREAHDLELFAEVLSGSESSPLDRALVYGSGNATRVSASIMASELSGLFMVTADVKPGVDPAVVEAELDAVLEAALTRAPTRAELDRARAREVSGFVRGTERLGGFGGRSDVLAQSMTYLGSADGYLQRFRNFSAATPESVRATAAAWLRKPSYTLQVDPFPPLRAVAGDVDRSVLPALADAPAVDFPDVQRATLGNGIDVVLLERHSTPLLNIALVTDAGTAADPAAAPGTATMALNLLLKGTTRRDAFRIADDRDALGATLGVGNSLDQSFVRMTALPANLRASLDLLADVARNPAFPDDMVDLQREQQLAMIGQSRANPGAAANRLLPTLLYAEGSPYAQPGGGLGTETAVAGLDRAALAAWHQQWFVPANTTLIIAGDITMDALLPALEASFGDWRGGAAPSKPAAAGNPAAGGRIYLVDKPGAPQSVIAAAHVTSAPGAPEDLALETVIRNFGGMATSRLNRNLRLEKHWSYGASGFVSGSRGQRTFAVFAPVQTDRTVDSMREVLREIEGVAGARPIAGEEFESILRSQVARLPGRFETLDSLVAAATDIVNTGRDPAYYDDYAANIATLTPEALNAAAAATVKPDGLTWVVIGDLKQIEAGIRALGWGEVVVLPAVP